MLKFVHMKKFVEGVYDSKRLYRQNSTKRRTLALYKASRMDVLASSERMVEHEKATQMRELYIRARYHDSEEMGNDEVKLARALLADIREQVEAQRELNRINMM